MIRSLSLSFFLRWRSSETRLKKTQKNFDSNLSSREEARTDDPDPPAALRLIDLMTKRFHISKKTVKTEGRKKAA